MAKLRTHRTCEDRIAAIQEAKLVLQQQFDKEVRKIDGSFGTITSTAWDKFLACSSAPTQIREVLRSIIDLDRPPAEGFLQEQVLENLGWDWSK